MDRSSSHHLSWASSGPANLGNRLTSTAMEIAAQYASPESYMATASDFPCVAMLPATRWDPGAISGIHVG